MTEHKPATSFKNAAAQGDHLEIDPAILDWFKARGPGWQKELNGVLDFYIDTVEHPATDPHSEPPDLKSGPA